MSRPAALRFEGDRARALEAIYLTPDVVAQREAVLAALDPLPGARVLDLGCGPGLLAVAIAKRVGAKGAVHGVDVSADMLAIAAAREQPEGAATVELSQQDVTALDMPDGSFDAAVCTQVYEYVDDMPAALAEVRRVLRPGGGLVVLDTDWDSIVWRSSDDARMARILTAWDEHLLHRDLPRRLPELLREAEFTVAEVQVVPLLNVGDDPETYSAGMRGLIAEFVTGHGVSEDEAAAWKEDLETLGDRSFFSLNRYLFTAVGP
jgi:SAM-dependent methyltransferase